MATAKLIDARNMNPLPVSAEGFEKLKLSGLNRTAIPAKPIASPTRFMRVSRSPRAKKAIGATHNGMVKTRIAERPVSMQDRPVWINSVGRAI